MDASRSRLIGVRERDGEQDTIVTSPIVGRSACPDERARRRRGLLFGSDRQPRRQVPGVAAVESSQHAVGRHRAVGRGVQSRRIARLAREDRRRQRGIDLPAGVVARQRACSSCRIAPAGGTCIAGGGDSLRQPQRERCITDGGRVRQAAVDVQHGHVCVCRREPDRGNVYGGRPMASGADRSRCANRFTPLDLPVEPIESIKARATNGHRTHRHLSSSAVLRPNPRPSTATRPGGRLRVLRSSATDPIAREWISVRGGGHLPVGDRDVHAFYYPPANPDVDRSAGNAAAADRGHAWRSDRRDARRARSEGAVLDQPRLRGARRELQRQHRLRAAVSRSPERAVGHRRRRGRRRRRAGDGGGEEGGSRIA